MFSRVLLYGLECCHLNKANLQFLDFTSNRLFMKLFRTGSIDVVQECGSYVEVELPSCLIKKKQDTRSFCLGITVWRICFVDIVVSCDLLCWCAANWFLFYCIIFVCLPLLMVTKSWSLKQVPLSSSSSSSSSYRCALKDRSILVGCKGSYVQRSTCRWASTPECLALKVTASNLNWTRSPVGRQCNSCNRSGAMVNNNNNHFISIAVKPLRRTAGTHHIYRTSVGMHAGQNNQSQTTRFSTGIRCQHKRR